MTRPAVAPDITTRSAWAKLMVSGSSAEHPRPASPNASRPAAVLPLDSDAMVASAAGEDERKHAIGAVGGKPALDRREEHSADRDHRPERGERERRHGRRGAEFGGHVELGPVPVHRLAHAVENREHGVEPESARDRHRAFPRGRRRGARSGLQREAAAGEQQGGEQYGGHDRKSPPEAETDEDRDEDRSERGAETEERVEHQDRPVDRRRMEHRGERVEDGNGEPESHAEARRGHQQQCVRERIARR